MCISQCSARVYKRTRTYVKKKREKKIEQQKKEQEKRSCFLRCVVWRKKKLREDNAKSPKEILH